MQSVLGVVVLLAVLLGDAGLVQASVSEEPYTPSGDVRKYHKYGA